MNELTTATLVLIRELRGKLCRCGKAKAEGHTFCGRCYRSLPEKLKRDIYKRVGAGYEEAYAAAVKVLERDEQAI